MIESLILIEGENVKEENLNISLMNAKQLVKGNVPRLGIILHLAADSPDDLQKALIEFSKLPDVKGVVTMVLRNS